MVYSLQSPVGERALAGGYNAVLYILYMLSMIIYIIVSMYNICTIEARMKISCDIDDEQSEVSRSFNCARPQVET